jgi:hypothetical protein
MGYWILKYCYGDLHHLPRHPLLLPARLDGPPRHPLQVLPRWNPGLSSLLAIRPTNQLAILGGCLTRPRWGMESLGRVMTGSCNCLLRLWPLEPDPKRLEVSPSAAARMCAETMSARSRYPSGMRWTGLLPAPQLLAGTRYVGFDTEVTGIVQHSWVNNVVHQIVLCGPCV